MRFADLVRLALRFIRTRFLESLMVVLGLAVGVGVISATFTLFGAMAANMRGSMNNVYRREIHVASVADSYSGTEAATKIGTTRTPDITFLPADLSAAKEACPTVEYAYTSLYTRLYLGGMPGAGGNSDTGASAAGDAPAGETERPPVEVLSVRCVMSGFFGAYGLHADEGSLFTGTDDENGTMVVVLGARAAELLFPDGGAVGQELTLNQERYRVIGVLEWYEPDSRPDEFSIDACGFMPVTATSHFRYMKRLQGLTFAVSDTDRLEAAVRELDTYFSGRYGEELITIVSSLDWNTGSWNQLTPVLLLVSFLAGTALLIASVNILNLMLARVVRRQKHIGISVAVGSDRRTVFLLFLTEALVLGCAGGALGCGAAVLLTKLLESLIRSGAHGGLPIPVTWTVIGISFLVTMAVNAVFGVYPAYRASKIVAVDAIREG